MNNKQTFTNLNLLFAGFLLLLVSPPVAAQEPSEKPSDAASAIASSTSTQDYSFSTYAAAEESSEKPSDAASAIDSSTQRQDDSQELTKQLANPIAALTLVPFQVDYNEGIGVGGNGQNWTTKIQPVVPFSLNDDWNLISRTILPVIDQQDVISPGSSQFGLGDTVQSLFFSPNEPGPFGEVFGIGLVTLLPTTTDDLLGSEKWGLGPTAIALKQQGGWTYGGLVNHIESVGGASDRADVSATFIQPFLSYATEKQTTFSISSEATYDWQSEQWSVPINLEVKQLLKIGKAPIQIGAGLRYWADSPDNGPQGWGARITATLIFPKFGR
jgi:hypothetical protein